MTKKELGAKRYRARRRILDILEFQGPQVNLTDIAEHLGISVEAVRKTLFGDAHSARVLQAFRDPMTIGVVMGGASALSSFMGAEQQRSSASYQADLMKNEAQVAENNAKAARQQAALELQKGEAAQLALDLERNTLRRQYEAQAGTNRSLLARGNVDITTGSAADSLLGNAQLFSEDLWVNRYNQALAGWQGRESSRLQEAQAIQYGNQAGSLRSQASWLKQSSGNLGTSLLTAGLSGATGFLGGYSLAGGSLFGATTSVPSTGATSWAQRRAANPFSLTL